MQTEGAKKLMYAIQNSYWVLNFAGITAISVQEVPTLSEIKREKITFGIGVDRSPVSFVTSIGIGDLVLKRMLIPQEADFMVSWITSLIPEKKNCSLKLYGNPENGSNTNKQKNLILTYEFEGCIPVNQKLGALSKLGKDWLFEEVVLSVDRMTVKGNSEKHDTFSTVNNGNSSEGLA